MVARERSIEAAAATAVPPSARGVNVIGFFRAEFGQGQVARSLVEALERAGTPLATVTHADVPHRQEHPFEQRIGEAVYATNILCLNAEHLIGFAEGPGMELLADRYSVGVWFWETSEFPSFLHPALDLVDEVWVASEFVAGAISPVTAKPVLPFPLPVEVPPAPPITRAELGLPDDSFVFLYVFDFYSTIERKNPIGLVEAYTSAFNPDDGAILFIKTINGDKKRRDLERLLAAAGGRDDIRVVDGYVEPERVRALTAHCDCYVSLHRSEGFGLTIAEAMAYGKPAIATAYSGNLTFMDEQNSYLVAQTKATVPEGCVPYPAGAEWAEPDVAEAARLMRGVFENPDDAHERALRGRETILRRHSVDRAAAFVAERLPQIERVRTERDRGHRPSRRARAFMTAGPTISWSARGRLGRVGVFARQILLRVLRPYLVRQREWELAVVAALEEAEANNAYLRDRVTRLEEQTRALAERVGGTAEPLDAAPLERAARPD